MVLEHVVAAGLAFGVYAGLTKRFVSARSEKLLDVRVKTKSLAENSKYPDWLTEPEHKGFALFFLASCFGVLSFSAALAVESFPIYDEALSTDSTWLYNAFVLIHWAIVLSHMVVTHGRWVLLSFTMTSWNLTGLHSLMLLLTPWLSSARFACRVLRFPMLLFNVTTFVIWWLVLFPLGFMFLKGKRRDGFMQMQTQYGLINVHFLNFPLALAEGFVLTNARPFTLFDLWVAFAFAFAYLCMYLTFLEPNGVHFYIILSPRSYICLAVYPSILLLFWSVWNSFNALSAID